MLSLMRGLSRLPLGLLQALGGTLGWLTYRLSAAYRRRLRENLERSGLIPAQSSERERRRWAVRSAWQAGCMIGELPWVWFRPLEDLCARIVCDDLDRLAPFEGADGRGIVLLTPHWGCFEAAGRYYSSRAPITVLFKPPKQAALVPVLLAARNSERMRSAPTTVAGLRVMLRALRRHEVVGLLPDQVPSDGEGEWVPFFGAPAYTTPLPGRLAEQTGAAVLLLCAQRLGIGQGWRLHVRPMAGPATALAVNRAMEEIIALAPEQYLWAYNRYKRPAGAPPSRHSEEVPPSPDEAPSASGPAEASLS